MLNRISQGEFKVRSTNVRRTIGAALMLGILASMPLFDAHAYRTELVTPMSHRTFSADVDSLSGQSHLLRMAGGHRHKHGKPWRPHGNHHGPSNWKDKLAQEIERGIKREQRRERRKRAVIGGIIGGAIILNEINKANQSSQQCFAISDACNRGNRFACDDYYRLCRR